MRNYGKKTRRYAVGGIVPKQADDEDEGVWAAPEKAHRAQLDAIRQYFIEKAGKGDPQEYELERNRGESLIQKGDRREYEIEEGSDDMQDLRDESERGT